jgi:hypothetical protein
MKDPDYASNGIALMQIVGPAGSPDNVERVANYVRQRQVGRLDVVGSNNTTGLFFG